MRVGLVGLGSIGRRHLANLLALGCEVVAMDVSEEARARAHAEFPHVAIFDALPMRYLEAIVIATPIPNHLQWVEDAIRRKLPFFVEKAIGTIEQLPRWRELAALDLPINQVGYNLRWHRQLTQARILVNKPTHGQFFLDCDATAWPGQCYGSLLLECSHEIDLALYCGAGELDSVDVDEHFADLWFGPNWCVRIRDDMPTYHRQWTVQQLGTEASVFFYAPEDLGTEMYVWEMKDFLDCVREKYHSACPLADGLKVLEVCAQVEQMTKAAA